MRSSGALLLASLTLILGTCKAADPEWWKTSVLYQIYPRSFADSDGDGNGDLRGILNHVDYLKDLGVGIVWLSPIYDSPMKDQGYDVSDFKKVNPLFGNLDDAKALIDAFHKNDMKFFMDFVPNHSSEDHVWFNASRYSDPVYKDYYVWRDSKGTRGGQQIPPNNWVSAFKDNAGRASAWTYDNIRHQFYLHQFGSYQPDLNYANNKVLDEMYAAMKFWLDLGVDGFRMDAVPFLIEDYNFRDELIKPGCTGDDCLDHIYTQNVKGTYEILKDLENRIIKDFNSTKFLYLEVYANPEQTVEYYYKDSSPFNFILITDLKSSTNATSLKEMVDVYLKGVPATAWPSWVIGNHDQSRVGTRLGEDFIDAANMMVLLLPGGSVTFQGEEIGMVDAVVPKERLEDCCGRDPQRTPFQWDDALNAGFSNSSNGTWLPVNPNYNKVNVKAETGQATSHLETYKRLLNLRKDLARSIETKTTAIGDWVLLFTRSNEDKTYYVILNLNNVETAVSLKSAFPDMPDTLTVHTPTGNAGFKIGDTLDLTKEVTLRPRSGLVVSSSSALLSSLALVLTALAALAARWD